MWYSEEIYVSLLHDICMAHHERWTSTFHSRSVFQVPRWKDTSCLCLDKLQAEIVVADTTYPQDVAQHRNGRAETTRDWRETHRQTKYSTVAPWRWISTRPASARLVRLSYRKLRLDWSSTLAERRLHYQMRWRLSSAKPAPLMQTLIQLLVLLGTKSGGSRTIAILHTT